jgi:hypothetical protein
MNHVADTLRELIRRQIRSKDEKADTVGAVPASSLNRDVTAIKSCLNRIYLPNGKFNVPYLLKNADILFEAGEYAAARKIYRAILQSGECTAYVMGRIEKCFEMEREAS